MAEPYPQTTLYNEVTHRDTAEAMGSGDVPVLATPRLIAWMEAATVEIAEPYLEPGQTTVGIAIRVDHRHATPIGAGVEITATLSYGVNGDRLSFHVQAADDSGQIVAAGEIDRAIVDRRRFLAKFTETRSALPRGLPEGR